MAARRGKLMTFKRVRSQAYQIARMMGNVQPWIELDARKIVRRQVHRKVGKAFSKMFFGGGGPSKIIKRILGL